MSKKTAAASPAPSGGGIPIPKSKRGLPGFLADVRRELTKVSWPTVPETNRLTGVVLAVCALLAVVLGVLGGLIGFVIDFLTGAR